MSDGKIPERLGDDEIARRIRQTVAGYDVPDPIVSGIPPRPRGENGLRFAVPATLVVVAILLFANLSRGVIDRRGDGPGATQVASSGAELTPALSTPLMAAPAPPDIQAYSWVNVQTIGPCPVGEVSQGMSACGIPAPPRLATVQLTASALDGGQRWSTSRELAGMEAPSDLARARSVAFPGAAGEVLYTANESNGGSIRSLDLMTGVDRERLRTRDLIQTAVYDASNGTVIAATVTPDERVDAGIWRLTLDSDASEPVAGPREDLDMSRRANGWSRRIHLTPDSRRLVSLDCADFSCEARVFDMVSSGLVSSAAGLRDDAVFGTTNDSLIGILDCPSHPCRISALALEIGALESVFDPCIEARAALASPDDEANFLAYGAVAGEQCDVAAVSSVNLLAATARRIWTAASPNDRALEIVQRGPGLAYSAPPGWVALGPGGGFLAESGAGGTAILLNLSDGRTIPIMSAEAAAP